MSDRSADLLTNSTDIFKALGSDFGLSDVKPEQRELTRAARRHLKPHYCASCGSSQSDVLRLEAAHIEPLSEFSETTLDNLVWLCRYTNGVHGVGCHILFDSGYCSVAKMRACRDAWAEDKTPIFIRESMMEMRDKYGPSRVQQGSFSGELRDLRAAQRALSNENDIRQEIQLQIAEIVRRRARRNSLARARRELIKIDASKFASAFVSARFHYEYGYVELLAGRLAAAYEHMVAGANILRDNLSIPGSRWRLAAHTAILAQIGRLRHCSGEHDGWSWNKIRQELDYALGLALADAEELKAMSGDWRQARRWVNNCLAHLVKPELAERNVESANRRLMALNSHWQTMDISSGWDSGSRPTLLALRSLTTFRFADTEAEVKTALNQLSRSIVLYGLRRRQPEGLRDLLFAFADALEKTNNIKFELVRSVATRCADFSSWFNPYIPVPPAHYP